MADAESRHIERNDEGWQRFSDLLSTPRFDDLEWHEEIAQAMMDLHFEMMDGKTSFKAPDGLLYLRLRFPQPGRYLGLSLREALQLPKGAIHGIAVVDHEGNPYYVLSHGDLLSLNLYGVLQVRWSSPWDQPNEYQTDDVNQVWVGSPNQEMLPERVRESLRALYDLFGNKEPKVTLIAPMTEEPHASDLVFDARPEMFSHPEQRDWFRKVAIYAMLPRHLRVRTVVVDWMLSTFPL